MQRWPTWNPEVKSVTLQGGLCEGSVFRWKTDTGTIVSTFQAIEPPHHVAWTGRTLTVSAVHVWRLAETNGKTTVKTAESFEGLLARMLRRRLQPMLQKTLERGLEMLRAEVEQQPPSP